jgi:hypothetical protein
MTSTASVLDCRPGLARALGTYRHALRHVAGGDPHHAGALQALDAIHGAAPHGVDVEGLIAAYLAESDAADAAETQRLSRAEPYTTVTWPCGDSITVEGDDALLGNVYARRVRIVSERAGNAGVITEEQRAEAIVRRRAYVASVR